MSKILDKETFELHDKNLRLKIFDFTEQPEIQGQLTEAIYIWKNDPDLISDDIYEESISDDDFSKFYDWFVHDFKLLDNGERIVERFQKTQFESLSEIEKQILEQYLITNHSYFEVIEISNNGIIKIKDLLSGYSFITDQSLLEIKFKISNIFATRPLYVNEQYFFPNAISIYPRIFKKVILDFYTNHLQEYKNSFGKNKNVSDYLKDWGYLIGQHLDDIAKHPQFLNEEGDIFVLSSALYKISDIDKAKKILSNIDKIKNITSSHEPYILYTFEPKENDSICANIEIENDNLTIECHSMIRLNETKKFLESKLKGLIKYKEDIVKNFDQFNVAGEINKKGKQIESDSNMDDYYEKWLDTPHPSLDGQTPRQISRTKEGLTKLNVILNELEKIYEHAKRREEVYYDVNKIRNKLRIS